MDSNIGRIPQDPTTAATPVRPVQARKRRPHAEEESSFEEELDQEGEDAPANSVHQPAAQRSEPRPSSGDPDLGGKLDLTG